MYIILLLIYMNCVYIIYSFLYIYISMYISTSTYVDVCMDSKHQRIVKLLLTVFVHSLVTLSTVRCIPQTTTIGFNH